MRDLAALEGASLPLIGAFAPAHLPYAVDRPVGEPTLIDLVDVALDKLGDDAEGVFLVVEGVRVDHASHGNDMARMVGEMAELDQVVARLDTWIAARDGVLVVTADHDCGGLVDVQASAAGTVPTGRWRWGNHSNADVRVAARGPGTEALLAADLDGRAVHALIAEAIDGEPRSPAPVMVPDGVLDDLPLIGAVQQASSSAGDGFGRLEALRVGADPSGLGIGVEGVFPWQTHGLVVLLDVDAGAGTGWTVLQGQLTDVRTPTDQLIGSLRASLPDPTSDGIDVAVVSLGGVETPYLKPLRGARGLGGAWGTPDAFARFDVALNYAVSTRTWPTAPLAVAPGRGFEVLLPWTSLWPDLGGGVPPDTVVALAVGLVELDGSWTNQLLPSLPAGAPAPSGGVRLPGLLHVAVDPDGDGIAAHPELR